MRGRRDVPPGAVAVSDGGGAVAVPIAFLAASVVETVVLHVLIPWTWLQVVSIVVSICSIVAVLGVLATGQVKTHYLTDTQFVLRRQGHVVAVVDRGAIAKVSMLRRYSEISPTCLGTRLVLPTPDGTTVDLILRYPIPATLRRFREPVSTNVTMISVSVEDPSVLLYLTSA